MALSLGAVGVPGLIPPEVLIFFRMPKTGGNTMDGVLEHCFPNEYFHGHVGPADSALLVRPTARIADKFNQLPLEQQERVRCFIGIHVSLDVDRIFQKPSKFFTIVRQPVDRVISNFYHNRTEPHLPSYPFIKDMSLEDYLDSRIGLDSDNHQVRLLSGCPELDAPWNPDGSPIDAPPVERKHLELAMRNIEERFVAAATLEQFTSLVWFLRRLYGWPLHKVLFTRRNENAGRKLPGDEGRPALERVSIQTRRRLAEMNTFDQELYDWVSQRFRGQLAPMEPTFSRELELFASLNRIAQKLHRMAPDSVRVAARRMLHPKLAA